MLYILFAYICYLHVCVCACVCFHMCMDVCVVWVFVNKALCFSCGTQSTTEKNLNNKVDFIKEHK